MLKLQTKSIDICRTSKLLAKYNIKAKLTDSTITLDGDISSELLNQLCDTMNIIRVQNFVENEMLSKIEESPFVCNEEIEKSEISKSPNLTSNNSDCKLHYDKIKYGQVYWCDFGLPYGSEQGGLRPAIVIQNDNCNPHNSTIIVIPSSISASKKNINFHYHLIFSSKTLDDYNPQKLQEVPSAILTDQIRVVDKSRLIDYIGILKPQYLSELQDKINFVLKSNKQIETVTNNNKGNISNIEFCKDFNENQLQLLSFVEINELLKILQSQSNSEVKIENILKLFGFDLNQNGVGYLSKAILFSLKKTYFNLKTLSESISKCTGVDQSEIERLIVARVKENFKLKKAPTIDFIRLVNIILLEQENNYEKNNF